MKTHTLTQEMTFTEALQHMLDGKCLGIRPGDNTNYLEFYTPHWMRSKTEFMLRWNNTENDNAVRSNQYLEKWYAVIIDHNDLKGAQ